MQKASEHVFHLYDILTTFKQWIKDGEREIFIRDMEKALKDIEADNTNELISSWAFYARGICQLVDQKSDPKNAFKNIIKAAELGHLPAQQEAVSSELFLKSGKVSAEDIHYYLNNLLYSDHVELAHIGNLDYLKGSEYWSDKFDEDFIAEYKEKAKYLEEKSTEIVFNSNQAIRLESISNNEISQLIDVIEKAVEEAKKKEQGWKFVETVEFGANTWVNVIAIDENITLDIVDWKSSNQLAAWSLGCPEVSEAIEVLKMAMHRSRKPLLESVIDNIMSGVSDESSAPLKKKKSFSFFRK